MSTFTAYVTDCDLNKLFSTDIILHEYYSHVHFRILL